MLLDYSVLLDADISTVLDAITYLYDQTDSDTAIARIDVGRTNPVAGGGDYQVQLWLNGDLVLPEFGLTVEPGTDKFTAISRPFPLINGDTVIVRVKGLPADTDVSVATYITGGTVATVEDDQLDELPAGSPMLVTVDGTTTQAHALRDQIELDRYLRTRRAKRGWDAVAFKRASTNGLQE